VRHNKEEISVQFSLITRARVFERHFSPLFALVIPIICPTLVIFVRGTRTYMAIGDELLRQDLDGNCYVAADGCCYTGWWRAKTVLVACTIAAENTWASCQRQVRDTKVADDVFTVTCSPPGVLWHSCKMREDNEIGRRSIF